MKNHEQLETMLRSSLTERAGDVDTTPALYERVQRRATRGTWLRRVVVLAGVAAVAVVAVVVVPPLLPAPELDIADTPEDAAPTDQPTADEGTEPAVPTDGGDAELTNQLRELGVAHAVDDGNGGSVLHVGERTISSTEPIVALDAATSDARTALVVGFADGSLAAVDVASSGEEFDQRIPANANGSKAIVAPLVDGVAWIEGTDLHVLPLADGAEVRIMPLEGDVPSNLEIEDWTAQADAQVILASEPDGGVWRIPMDDSNVTNSAPTDPASVLDADAVDATLLADLTQVALRVPGGSAGTSLVIGTDVIGVGDGASHPTAELSGNGQVVTLLDPTTRSVLVLHVMDDGNPVGWDWYGTGIAAAVSITGTSPAEPPPPGNAPPPPPTTGDASALGLATDAPVVGTSGRFLVVVSAPEEGPVTESDRSAR